MGNTYHEFQEQQQSSSINYNFSSSSSGSSCSAIHRKITDLHKHQQQEPQEPPPLILLEGTASSSTLQLPLLVAGEDLLFSSSTTCSTSLSEAPSTSSLISSLTSSLASSLTSSSLPLCSNQQIVFDVNNGEAHENTADDAVSKISVADSSSSAVCLSDIDASQPVYLSTQPSTSTICNNISPTEAIVPKTATTATTTGTEATTAAAVATGTVLEARASITQIIPRRKVLTAAAKVGIRNPKTVKKQSLLKSQLFPVASSAFLDLKLQRRRAILLMDSNDTNNSTNTTSVSSSLPAPQLLQPPTSSSTSSTSLPSTTISISVTDKHETAALPSSPGKNQKRNKQSKRGNSYSICLFTAFVIYTTTIPVAVVCLFHITSTSFCFFVCHSF